MNKPNTILKELLTRYQWLDGNNNLIYLSLATLLITTLLVFFFFPKSDENNALLLDKLSNGQEALIEDSSSSSTMKAIVEVNPEEERILKLEKAKEKRLRIEERRNKTRVNINDSLDSLSTADIPVESFGSEIYAFETPYSMSFREVAQRFNCTIETLKAENPTLNNDKVDSLATINVPLRAIHIIETGDNLTQLSKNYLVDKNTIRKANAMKNDYLNIGDPLLIPNP